MHGNDSIAKTSWFANVFPDLRRGLQAFGLSLERIILQHVNRLVFHNPKKSALFAETALLWQLFWQN